MRFAPLFVLCLALAGRAGSPEYFIPKHRVSGIGVARDDLSGDLLAIRTGLMIESQTFYIMREGLALAGARRIIDDPKLQSVFRKAAQRSGLPASLLEAIAYLESFGDPNAVSPAARGSLAAPRGIMQISQDTARDMGIPVLQ